jgi:flagellar basal body L-ring protein FlgH
MPIEIGMTKGWRLASTIVRPSTAESTEMAGVIIASPKNRQVASTPIITRLLVHFRPGKLREISASRARLPAFAAIVGAHRHGDILTVTISINDQKISEITPKMCSGSTAKGCGPMKLSFIA